MTLTRELLKQSWRSWISNDLRRVGPYWLQWVWTTLFATAIGILFTLAGFAMYARSVADWTSWPNWRHWLGLNLFISYFSAFTIHLMLELLIFVISRERIRNWPTWMRGLFFSSVPLVGVFIAWPVAVRLSGYSFGISDSTSATSTSAGMLLFVLMFSMGLNFYFNANARTQAAERRAAEAQLRLLQGQIEPHFLFNTLANVVGLMDRDTPRAKAMLESFVDYLRSSFGGMRQASPTLGHELDLVEAYLRILKIRMDDRLDVRIAVAPELRALPLPALTVQPLVENAIQHGLEPKIEGGRVEIAARLDGRVLTLTVTDDGLGLPEPGAARRDGNGSALANIRARIAHSHGDAATLRVEPHAPHGVCATLTLPV